jgi:hypothetical protein
VNRGEYMEELKEIIPNQFYSKFVEFIKTTAHGSVTLIIQDGRIIQVERSEKVRLPKS